MFCFFFLPSYISSLFSPRSSIAFVRLVYFSTGPFPIQSSSAALQRPPKINFQFPIVVPKCHTNRDFSTKRRDREKERERDNTTKEERKRKMRKKASRKKNTERRQFETSSSRGQLLRFHRVNFALEEYLEESNKPVIQSLPLIDRLIN